MWMERSYCLCVVNKKLINDQITIIVCLEEMRERPIFSSTEPLTDLEEDALLSTIFKISLLFT